MASYTLAFVLQPRKKYGKPSVRVEKNLSQGSSRRVIMNARSWTMKLTEGGAEEYRIIICVEKAITA